MNEALQLIPSKTDAQEADEVREQLEEPLALCCEILTCARAKGLQVSFQIQNDQFGRFIPVVGIVKPL